MLRVALFPLMILAQRNAAEMQNHMPTMQRLQKRMIEARRLGDVQDGLCVVFISYTVNEDRQLGEVV